MRGPLLAVMALALAAGCAASREGADRVATPPAAGAVAPGGIDTPPEPVAVPPLVRGLEAMSQAEFPVAGSGPERPACAPGEERPARTAEHALAAVVKNRAPAFTRPHGKRIAVFEERNVNDVPTVLGVLSSVLDERCETAWYRVQLPMRPNGRIGYVRASDVAVAPVRTRIVVDLSERRLDFYRDGERILRSPVAIGASITPTPKGSFYVNQRLVAPDPWGPFGPAALGISAFSDVLQDWSQGGPIAIHGTNDPGSIGQAVSHGCIRVANETIEYLFRETLAGTPIEIRA